MIEEFETLKSVSAYQPANLCANRAGELYGVSVNELVYGRTESP